MIIRKLEDQKQELKDKDERLTALAKKMIKSHNRLEETSWKRRFRQSLN